MDKQLTEELVEMDITGPRHCALILRKDKIRQRDNPVLINDIVKKYF